MPDSPDKMTKDPRELGEAPVVDVEQKEEEKDPETVAEELRGNADRDMSEFKEVIPDDVASTPEMSDVVTEAEEAHDDFEKATDEVVGEAQKESQQQEAQAAEAEPTKVEIPPDVYDQLNKKLERIFSVLSENPDLESYAGEKSHIEALQGKLVEGKIFDEVKYGHDQDGKLVLEDGASVYDFLKKEQAQNKQSSGEDNEVLRQEQPMYDALDDLKADYDAKQGAESKEGKEKLREDILTKLDGGIEIVRGLYDQMSPEDQQSDRGKEMAGILQSVEAAKAQSVDAGNDEITVELRDGEGNIRKDEKGEPITQQEGIPVDGIIDALKARQAEYDVPDLGDDEKRRMKQLEEIIPQDERLADSAAVPPKNVDHFNDKNKAELDALMAKAKEASAKKREQIDDIIQTLEDNSKPYFEKHFGKASTELTKEEQDKQHLRTEHEAYLISQDSRATGTPEGDYEKAMDEMSKRRELVLPQEESPESEPTPEPVPEEENPEEEDSKPEEDKQDDTEPIPEQPKPEEEKPEEEPGEKSSLETLRNAYAVAVNGKKKFFGRVSQEHVEDIRAAYEDALEDKFRNQIKEEFKGMDLENQEVLEQYLERQAELAIDAMNERELLVDALNTTEDKKGKKFRDWWKRNPKMRMAISVALTGTGFAAGMLGVLPVAGAAFAAKAALSGVGTTMTTASAWEAGRRRFSKEKEMSEEQIKEMSYEELEEIYAAQSVGAADHASKRGKYRTFFGREKDSKTAGYVEEELKRRAKEALRKQANEMREKGATTEDILYDAIDQVLANEEQGHEELEKRTDWLRKNNIKKWATSAIAGGVVATLVGVRGLNKMKEMVDAKAPVPNAAQPEAPQPDAANPETSVPPAGTESGATPEVPPVAAGTEAASAGTETAANAAAETAHDVVTVEKGDSVWKVVENQLHERMGDKFTSMPEGARTHLIDQFKDRVVANPEQFGLHDADKLMPGDKIDLSHLFQGDAVKEAAEKTAELTQDQIHNIEANNDILRQWVLENPGEQLTSNNVDSIIEHVRNAAEGAGEAVQQMQGNEVAEQYMAWLGDHPEAAHLNFKDSMMQFATDQQHAHDVAEAAKNVPDAVKNTFDPLRNWIEQNPGKPLDKETFLKLVNGPTAHEALEASGQLTHEAVGRIPEALEPLTKYTDFVESGHEIVLKAGVKAMKHAGEITDTLFNEGHENTVKALTNLKLGDIMKGVKGAVSKMEGVDDSMAHKFAKAAKELVKQADKASGSPVDRNWTLGMLSKVVRLSEKGK